MTSKTITPSKLAELAARVRAMRAPEPVKVPAPANSHIFDKYGNLIELNEQQMEFVRIAGIEGQSAVLIGAAGTGKTTTQRAVTEALIQSGRAGVLGNDMDHSHLMGGTPGIVICAYTRRAVNNIRKNLPANLASNAITIHKLLEYQPEYSEVTNEETGDTYTKMSFQPKRTSENPLPASIRVIIFEEASMIGTDLHAQVVAACPHQPQYIYLGDIQQLPPVFGPAILGFKLNSLPVVELTQVYRQALESPIIALAHRILSGKGIPASEFPAWHFPDKLKLHPWKKKLSPEAALSTAAMFFNKAIDTGAYDVEEDIILVPFNKSCGTDELNLKIANHLARKRMETTYEIIAGFQKVYLSPGDKVMYEKEDARVISIERNPAYCGKPFQQEATTLDYWGYNSAGSHEAESSVDIDTILGSMAAGDNERTTQASHIVKIQSLERDGVITLKTAGEINSLALGYAITVHKSQGCEWRKVFILFHQSHAVMLQRELLYTAVTRAREELYVICEPESFMKGIENARIKGTTLQEKAEYFKGKYSEADYLE